MYQKQYEIGSLDDGTKTYLVKGYSFGIVEFESSHRNQLYEFVWKKTRGKSSNLQQVWLINDMSIPIGFMSYWMCVDKPIGDLFRFVLECIEIREEYRGQGLAKFLIEEVENYIGETLYSTGHFTPLGYESLNGLLPVADNSAYNNYGKESVEFEDMSFVKDWDRMIPNR